jgi:regulator of replication initiation timing
MTQLLSRPILLSVLIFLLGIISGVFICKAFHKKCSDTYTPLPITNDAAFIASIEQSISSAYQTKIDSVSKREKDLQLETQALKKKQVAQQATNKALEKEMYDLIDRIPFQQTMQILADRDNAGYNIDMSNHTNAATLNDYDDPSAAKKSANNDYKDCKELAESAAAYISNCNINDSLQTALITNIEQRLASKDVQYALLDANFLSTKTLLNEAVKTNTALQEENKKLRKKIKRKRFWNRLLNIGLVAGSAYATHSLLQ